MDAPDVLSDAARFALTEEQPDLAAMRGWAAELLVDVPEEVRLDVLLVCTELASNAYEHADGPRVVRIERREDLVRVEVDDGTPATLPNLGESRLSDLRGRGLVMVAHISRCWGTRGSAHGKTVWAEISA